MNFRTIMTGALIIALTFFIVPAASAHGGQPRLEISAERPNPGAVVEVRGVEFAYDEVITLALIGSGVDISLGEVISDAEDEFKHIVVLPSDLVEGTYYFRAVTSHHWVISPPLTVWGTAVSAGEGGEGPREEDDGLLAPMPTFAPAVATAPIPQAASQAPPVSPWNQSTVIVSILAIIGILIVFGVRIMTK